MHGLPPSETLPDQNDGRSERAPPHTVVGIPEDWTDLSDDAKDVAVERMLAELGRSVDLALEHDVDDDRSCHAAAHRGP